MPEPPRFPADLPAGRALGAPDQPSVYQPPPADGVPPGFRFVEVPRRKLVVTGAALFSTLYAAALIGVIFVPHDSLHVGHTLVVPVTEREDDPTRFVPLLTADEPLIARLGILGLTLNSKAASLLKKCWPI